MNNSKDVVNAAIKTAINVYYEQTNVDNLHTNRNENYNNDILKIAELIILAETLNK